jgi:putative transposase
VRLVVSDAHQGLKAAIAGVLGPRWQALRGARRARHARPRARQSPLVRGALKQVFAARDQAGQVGEGVIAQLEVVAPKVARLLEDAEKGPPGLHGLPREHWSEIRSTNPLERVKREIARRSDVVGIDPNGEALLRLAAGVLVEINDEWLVAHRYLSQVSMALLQPNDHGPCGPAGAGQPALESALAGAGKSTT